MVHDNAVDAIEFESSLQIRQSSQIPRLSCSDLSKIAALHFYTDVLEMIDKYLYQNLPDLFESDLIVMSNIYGPEAAEQFLHVCVEEDEIEELLEKVPVLQRKELKEICGAAESLRSSSSVAQTSIDKITTILTPSVPLSLSATESEQLSSLLQRRVRMDFGKNAEDETLNHYEKMKNIRIVERNTNFLYLPIYDGSNVGRGDEDELVLSSRCTKFAGEHSPRTQSNHRDIEPGNQSPSSSSLQDCGNMNEVRRTLDSVLVALEIVAARSVGALPPCLSSLHQNSGLRTKQPHTLPSPLFYICGRADGVVYVPSGSSGEGICPNNVHRVVLEVKSRVSKLHPTPPLPDIIQLCSYLVMYRAERGELIQALLHDDDGCELVEAGTSRRSKAPTTAIFSVPFEGVADDNIPHMELFALQVLPRVKSFARFIRWMHHGDRLHFRLCYLQGDAAERRALVAPHLDYIEQDCASLAGEKRSIHQIAIESQRKIAKRQNQTSSLTAPDPIQSRHVLQSCSNQESLESVIHANFEQLLWSVLHNFASDIQIDDAALGELGARLTTEGTLEFPCDFTKRQRMAVHSLCGLLRLEHASHGESSNRRVVVSRPPQPSYQPQPSVEVEVVDLTGEC